MLTKVLFASVMLAVPFVAQAADMPSAKAPANVAAVQAADSWTGGYIGAIGGYGWGTSAVDAASTEGVIDNNISIKSKGGFGGLQAGYDWQAGNNIVFGLAGDIAFGSLNGNYCAEDNYTDVTPGACGNPTDRTSYISAKTDWLGTVRARAGFSAGSLLVYGTGGAAFAGMKLEYTNNSGLGDNDSAKKTIMGWAVGGGAEYKLSKNVSIGAEYLHVDFGSNTYSFTAPSGNDFNAKIDTKAEIVRASLNYRF